MATTIQDRLTTVRAKLAEATAEVDSMCQMLGLPAAAPPAPKRRAPKRQNAEPVDPPEPTADLSS